MNTFLHVSELWIFFSSAEFPTGLGLERPYLAGLSYPWLLVEPFIIFPFVSHDQPYVKVLACRSVTGHRVDPNDWPSRVTPVSCIVSSFSGWPLFMDFFIIYLLYRWNTSVHHYSERGLRPTEGCKVGSWPAVICTQIRTISLPRIHCFCPFLPILVRFLNARTLSHCGLRNVASFIAIIVAFVRWSSRLTDMIGC